jgi:acyl-CoA reductase-like NAD-dependent aldehyde dehydrogenase
MISKIKSDIRFSCHSASANDVEETVQVAYAAYKSGVWSKATRQTRAEVLEKAAEVLTANMDDLIKLEVRQTGRAIREMKAQVPSLVKWFRYFASLIRTEERAVLPTTGPLHNWIDRVPLGVVVQITPLYEKHLRCFLNIEFLLTVVLHKATILFSLL